MFINVHGSKIIIQSVSILLFGYLLTIISHSFLVQNTFHFSVQLCHGQTGMFKHRIQVLGTFVSEYIVLCVVWWLMSAISYVCSSMGKSR